MSRRVPASARRAISATFLVVTCVLFVVAPSWASAQTSDLTVTLATLEEGVPSTGPLFGGNEVLEYQITVDNSAADPSGALIVDDTIPRASVYVSGSASCGSAPDCIVNENSTNPNVLPFTVAFALTSVPADSVSILDFEVTPRTGSLFGKMSDTAHWTGAGCAAKRCLTNRIAIPVLPRPVTINSRPGNDASVLTGHPIDYTFIVHNHTQTIQNDVTVTDNVPAGTTYVPGSASCLQTPGCTVSVAGVVVTFTIASVPPRTKGDKFKMGYQVAVTTTSSTITNVGVWTGDLCAFSTPCPTNTIRQAVIPGLAKPATVAPTSVAPTSVAPTSVAPTSVAPTSVAPTTVAPTTTRPVAPQPVTSRQPPAPVASPPPATASAQPKPKANLALSPATISLGESTVASGTGCPSGSYVVISIDGRLVTVAIADDQGDFSASVTPSDKEVGQDTVTATCGSVQLSTTLTIVVTSSGTAPESSAAFFGVFVLLGGVLLRGQFMSDVRRPRRKRLAPGMSDALRE